MASFPMFGGSAPRSRRLQPMGNQIGPSIEEMQAQAIAQMQADHAANEEMLLRAQNTSGGRKVPKPGGAFGAELQVEPAPPSLPSSEATSTDAATGGPKMGAFMLGAKGQSVRPLTPIEEAIKRQDDAYFAGPNNGPRPPPTAMELAERRQDDAYFAGPNNGPDPQSPGTTTQQPGSAFTPPAKLGQPPAPLAMGEKSMTREEAIASGMAKPKKQPGILEMFGYDEEATGMPPLQWMFSSPDAIRNAKTEVTNKAATARELQYRQDVRKTLRNAGYTDEWIDAYSVNPTEGAKTILEAGGFTEINGQMVPKNKAGDYRNEPARQPLAEGMMYDDNGNIVRQPGYWEAKQELAAAGKSATSGQGAATYLPATKEQKLAFGINPDLPAKYNELTREVEIIPGANQTPKATPMQISMDKNFVADLVDWQLQGSVNFQKDLSQLNNAIKELDSGKELSGIASGIVFRSVWGGNGKVVQQQVEQVVQSSLRAILGAAFTQKEGEGILARTFDPMQEEYVNSARAKLLVAQMKIAAEQKNAALQYYNENGTMAGYVGHIPTGADMDAAVAAASPEKLKGAKQFIDEVWPTLSEKAKSSPDAKKAYEMSRAMLGIATPAPAQQSAAKAPPQQPTQYQRGDIEIDDETGQKFRFLGGDDKVSTNWEPVR